MRLKKLVPLFLTASLALSSLTGCSTASSVGNEAGTSLDDSKKVAVNKNDPFYKNAQAGIFRIAGGFDPPETAHGNVWSAGSLSSCADFIHEKLFDYVPLPEKTYMPVLGTSFEEEGNVITIHLREGVNWSDGTPFTSKDVVSTFHLGFIGGWLIWDYLESIEAVDDYTVVATFKTTNAITTQLLTNSTMNSPYHIYKEWADQAATIVANRKPGTDDKKYDEATTSAIEKLRESLYAFKPDILSTVGTGPFTLTNLTSSQATLKKSDTYWNPNNIKMNEVHILRTSSLEAQLNLIMSSGYDMENLGLSPDVHQQVLKDNPNMRVILGADLGQPSLQFNTRIAPMDNILVRQAIHHLIDRESLLYIAEPGSEAADLTSSGMIPLMRDEFLSKEFLDTLTVYNHDTSKAEELLLQAGWTRNDQGTWVDENGQIPEIEFATTNSYPTFFLCADAIVNQLNEFGIKATLKSMEASSYWKYLQEQGGMMSISMRPGSPNYGEPWEVYRSFFLDGAGDMGFVSLADNRAGNKDIILELSDGSKVEVLPLVNELLTTPDPERKTELTEFLAKTVNELSVFMPLLTKYIPQKIYNPFLTGYPEDSTDVLWYGSGATKVAARLIREGKLYYEIPSE